MSGEECRLREATFSDLRDVYRVEVESFPYPYPVEAFITYLVMFPKYFIVAECSGEVVGYVAATVTNEGNGHVVSIAVRKEFRRRGLGRRLMEAVEGALREDGIKKIYLEVAVNNTTALNLYRKLGYRVASRLGAYYPDSSDAYVMVKELTD